MMCQQIALGEMFDIFKVAHLSGRIVFEPLSAVLPLNMAAQVGGQ